MILTSACTSTAPPAAPPQATGATPAPTSQAPSTPASAVLGTPEDAVHAYLAGVASNDVEAILEASAVEEASEGFDFVAQADRLKIIQPVGQPGPAEYPFYADINRSLFASRLLSQAQTLSYSMLSSTPIVVQPVPADGPAASAFVAEVDPAQLADLQVVDVRPPDPSLENDPQARSNALAVAAIYGASDSVQRVALLELGGSHYEVGFELLKYGDDWRVMVQSSSIAGLPGTGAATPITPEEFEEQTSGD